MSNDEYAYIVGQFPMGAKSLKEITKEFVDDKYLGCKRCFYKRINEFILEKVENGEYTAIVYHYKQDEELYPIDEVRKVIALYSNMGFSIETAENEEKYIWTISWDKDE